MSLENISLQNFDNNSYSDTLSLSFLDISIIGMDFSVIKEKILVTNWLGEKERKLAQNCLTI